jgi:protein SCO1/2
MKRRQFSIANCQWSIVNWFSAVVFLAVSVSMIQAAERLPIIQKAAEFNLIDQSGRRVRLADYKGKVVLVSFVFTTCSGSCPATTARMAKIQEHLQKRGLMEKGVRLVSISLDPKRDTPEVLRGYMRLFEADGSTWSFLTGPPDKVAKTIAAWGMWAKPAANGQLDHPSRIFLVDRKGQIREIYNLEFLRVPWVTEDVELLLREK